MTRCDTCDECLGACSCDVQAPVAWKQAELTDFVWYFGDLVKVDLEEEVADE